MEPRALLGPLQAWSWSLTFCPDSTKTLTSSVPRPKLLDEARSSACPPGALVKSSAPGSGKPSDGVQLSLGWPVPDTSLPWLPGYAYQRRASWARRMLSAIGAVPCVPKDH
jgi:hypothetical protein